MSDIVVYTNPTTLENKKDLGFEECSWKFKRFPRDVLPNNKIYFATRGMVRGYFFITRIDRKRKMVFWEPKSWKEPKRLFLFKEKTPCKFFGGFRYAETVIGRR